MVIALGTIDDSAKPVRYLAAEIVSFLMTKGPKPEAVRRALDGLPAKKRAIADEILGRIQQDTTVAPIPQTAVVSPVKPEKLSAGVKPTGRSTAGNV